MAINPVEWYKKRGLRVTSPYGPRAAGKNFKAGFHNGTDFGGIPCGAPVHTPYGGTVVLAATRGMGTWGNTVVIRIAEGLLQLTAHHERLLVKKGDIVAAGDQIATNGGSTHVGKIYACHIHYEIRIDDGSRVVGGRPWGDPATFWLDQEPTKPSRRFSAGDIIVNGLDKANVNVRVSPNGQRVAQVEPGERVVVVEDNNNGVWKDGHYWWKTEKGWVAEAFFGVLLEADPEPEVPPELIEDIEEAVAEPEELRPLLKKLYKILKQLFGG